MRWTARLVGSDRRDTPGARPCRRDPELPTLLGDEDERLVVFVAGLHERAGQCEALLVEDEAADGGGEQRVEGEAKNQGDAVLHDKEASVRPIAIGREPERVRAGHQDRKAECAVASGAELLGVARDRDGFHHRAADGLAITVRNTPGHAAGGLSRLGEGRDRRDENPAQQEDADGSDSGGTHEEIP